MSCISNCVVNFDKFPECVDEDEFLHYKVKSRTEFGSTDEKMELFRQCHQMIAERKQFMQKRPAGEGRMKKPVVKSTWRRRTSLSLTCKPKRRS